MSEKKYIDTFIEYNNSRSPFYIEPRCRLGRMIKVIGDALSIKPTSIKIMHHGNVTNDIINEDQQKFLIEDYNIKEGDIIVFEGDDTGNESKYNNKMETITLSYKDEDIITLSVAETCTVSVIQKTIAQNGIFVPNTIKLFYADKYLSNPSAKIFDIIGEGEKKIRIEGLFFPTKILGDNYDFIENHQIFVSSECCICLDKLTSATVMECGHRNICDSCIGNYKDKLCPLCINNEKK